MSPAARSLKLLRSQGWTCAMVERYNPFARTRHDLFGGIDLVAVKPGVSGVLGVQSTTASHQSGHTKRLLAIPELRTWRTAGNGLELHLWGLVSGRGRGGKCAQVKIVRL